MCSADLEWCEEARKKEGNGRAQVGIYTFTVAEGNGIVGLVTILTKREGTQSRRFPATQPSRYYSYLGQSTVITPKRPDGTVAPCTYYLGI